MWCCNSKECILLHLLWADDLVLLVDSPSSKQKQLDGLFKFVSSYQMIVNEMKTKIVIYGKSNPNQEHRFQFNYKDIDIVESYKYLGCIFNSCNSIRGNIFKEMVTYSADKAIRASFAVVKKYSSVGYLSPKIGIHLFDTCISPILNYSSEIWCTGKESTRIERVQLRFLKLLLGVKNSTCNLAIYGETGRFPLILYQKLKVVDYWLRLVRLNKNSLLTQVFRMVKNLHNSGFKTLLGTVESILKEANLEAYLECDHMDEKVCNTVRITLKTFLYDSYVNDWYKDISAFPKMRSLVTFKHTFRLETYLLTLTDFKLRKLLSKFRMSSHDLEIEKGRYLKPAIPACERICKLCNTSIENEEHVLVECKTYRDLRLEYFKKTGTVQSCDTSTTFINLINSEDSNIIFYTAKYLEKVLVRRSQLLK